MTTSNTINNNNGSLTGSTAWLNDFSVNSLFAVPVPSPTLATPAAATNNTSTPSTITDASLWPFTDLLAAPPSTTNLATTTANQVSTLPLAMPALTGSLTDPLAAMCPLLGAVDPTLAALALPFNPMNADPLGLAALLGMDVLSLRRPTPRMRPTTCPPLVAVSASPRASPVPSAPAPAPRPAKRPRRRGATELPPAAVVDGQLVIPTKTKKSSVTVESFPAVLPYPEGMIAHDAPVQARGNHKRPAPPSDEDEEPEIPDDLDEAAAKRLKNALSARRSRARKLAKIAFLEDRVNELQQRNAELEATVRALQAQLPPSGSQ
ncbi:hypothetical protein AMAG_14596 [Allomyces macrogynus ATCC 38327]|uniref:BZIP domain-containing protein n=1 Tax=Allomyces macrogynus (strain ATCC 38327) TaxID=578462 RepID=A0A0L0T6X0_ALLM3|nr:hypothetical protein AMAG_14596 [Allomyces macrogynus ATCC 38327]|eukprot:KNE70470.1 hypothetical protein AMAG_14596 [Allomyces macrogynus ATCC 38327]